LRTDSRDPLTETLPIGPLQEGIWLFWQLNPTSPAYGMPEIFHFDGDFDLEAAQLALDGLIRRHEALRTTFHETGSGVVQIIDRDPEPVPIEVVDLRGLPPAERVDRRDSTLAAAANRPFDLTAEPPIRLTAVRVSDSQTSLVAVAHHIACDGLSMSVLLDELGELYRSARRGTPPGLGPVPPGHGTFVKEQLAALDDDRLDEESAYWRERLAGVTGSALPGAQSAATRAPGEYATCTVSTALDQGSIETLSALARRARSTPFAILLGAMDVMIAAATGEGEVVLATATSGRTPRFARTVGVLANVVVTRSQIDLARTFTATLGDVTLDLMDAIDHQDLPFSRVVAELHDAGFRAGIDLVRTEFSAGGTGDLDLGEGSLSGVVARTVEGPFELAVNCHIEPSVVALDWEFALRRYPREVADGYCAAYQEVLAALLRRPDAPMASLGLTEILGRVDLAPGRDAASPDATARPEEKPDPPPDVELTPVEEAVAAIWSEVMGVPVRSPDDHFFDLGGHSLLAIQAVALVRRRVSPVVSVRLLFDHPQLGEFASRLEVAPGGG
jgi:hypothetical protein